MAAAKQTFYCYDSASSEIHYKSCYYAINPS